MGLALVAVGCGGGSKKASGGASTTAGASTGTAQVQMFDVPSRNHVLGQVNYPQTPPVGGDHYPVWQNCGFYSTPIQSELGVHSLEHGAVWITFRPDLPKAQVDTLRALAHSRTYILVSPWKDSTLPAPVVASAWGKQVRLTSASDPGLAQFVRTYAAGPQAPEPGAPCTNGLGNPE